MLAIAHHVEYINDSFFVTNTNLCSSKHLHISSKYDNSTLTTVYTGWNKENKINNVNKINNCLYLDVQPSVLSDTSLTFLLWYHLSEGRKVKVQLLLLSTQLLTGLLGVRPSRPITRATAGLEPSSLFCWASVASGRLDAPLPVPILSLSHMTLWTKSF